jgi:hypothetical protein
VSLYRIESQQLNYDAFVESPVCRSLEISMDDGQSSGALEADNHPAKAG